MGTSEEPGGKECPSPRACPLPGASGKLRNVSGYYVTAVLVWVGGSTWPRSLVLMTSRISPQKVSSPRIKKNVLCGPDSPCPQSRSAECGLVWQRPSVDWFKSCSSWKLQRKHPTQGYWQQQEQIKAITLPSELFPPLLSPSPSLRPTTVLPQSLGQMLLYSFSCIHLLV